MTHIRPTIAKIMPSRMLACPVDRRGYPVPWFITVKDEEGEWDFRVLDPRRYIEAIRKNVCWICGIKLGRHQVFVVGPMCGVNRLSAEPPAHLECAEFAVRTCPFMLLPKTKRREANLPPAAELSEYSITRNPGVMLLWTTDSYQVVRAPNQILFRMGEPSAVTYWREGRAATRDEIMQAVSTGLPQLQAMAEAEGRLAVEELGKMRAKFETLMPPM